MPFATTDDGVRLNYALAGPPTAPLLVLSNSLGTSLAMWEPQMPALTRRFRVLRYDMRGHGRSDLPPAAYAMDRLGRDVLALLDAAGAARGHFCGLSMSGMVGMWLGIHAPQRIDRLVLCNTAACIGTAEIWNQRIAAVTEAGVASVAAAVVERWFTPEFQVRSPAVVERYAALLRATAPQGYAAACAAIRDTDLRAAIAAITAPTMVIAGADDVATPPADGRAIAARIAGARYVELAAAHLSNAEAPDAFNRALDDFLQD